MEEEYREPGSVKGVSFKWGIIGGIAFIALGLVFQAVDLAGESWTGYVNLLPLIGVLFLAHNEYKSTGDGYMNYGQGLGIGTLVCLIASVVSSIFSYIYISFVDDSLIGKMKEQAYEEWDKQGLSGATLDQAEKMLDFFANPTFIAIAGIFSGVFFGFLITLIVSAITKETRPPMNY